MLPLIAMITMLIDHVGLLFFPESEGFRIIGRIAFPLYCWFLVQGYVHTSSHRRYMWRLFGLACISQVPYTLAFNEFELNVIFTLLLSLLALYAAERIPREWVRLPVLAAIAAAAAWVPMDYGIYGVLLVFLYRYTEGWKAVGGHLLLNVLFLLGYGPGYWMQLFSVAGTVLAVFLPPVRGLRVSRLLYRSFYPAHLAALYLAYTFYTSLNP